MKYPKSRFLLVLGFLLLFALALAACGEAEPEEVEVEVTRVVEVPVEVEGPPVEVEVEVTRVVEVPAELTRGEEVASAIDFIPLWEGSGHNDVDGEPFNHWNEDDPAEVPTACARCHSTPGYRDFLGVDGSEAGVVDAAAPIGTTVECAACHNDVTLSLTEVTFPSGITVTDLGDDSRCMICHQGRESTVSVSQSFTDAGLGPDDEDTVSEDIGFRNIHYYAAAATLYGTQTKGGFEYEGKSYDGKFDHVPGYDTCIACHDQHTLEVRFDECSQCHQGLEDEEDLLNVRMFGSLVDYDGDGDTDEGIYYEIEGMRDLLYEALQAYGSEVAGSPIVYDGESYPYFFDDAGERYASWTPRLVKAAYNYQVSLKDPGRFAHGGKYIIELLYDSIESLNEAIATPVDLSSANRIDAGHFAGSEEAFRHWDEDGAVSQSCTRCHSAAGLPLFIEQGVSIEQPTANGLNCATCHNDLTQFTRYETESVPFPSGASLSLVEVDEENGLDANLCLNCHQGRESTVSVNRRIGDSPDDEVAEGLGFANVHYFAAGASLFGTEAKGAYEFDGQTYNGRNEHVGGYNVCIECHSTHGLQVKAEECGVCHEGVSSEEDLHSIRVNEIDYDGDGDVEEGIALEVETMQEALLAAMNEYAAGIEGVSPIEYNGASYPYFFDDAGERYATWTPNLLRAAYNYQYSQKDPGAFAHNGQYMLQVLYDSLVAMGADVSGMTRPAVAAPEG